VGGGSNSNINKAGETRENYKTPAEVIERFKQIVLDLVRELSLLTQNAIVFLHFL
jgi:hypothetical protein